MVPQPKGLSEGLQSFAARRSEKENVFPAIANVFVSNNLTNRGVLEMGERGQSDYSEEREMERER